MTLVKLRTRRAPPVDRAGEAMRLVDRKARPVSYLRVSLTDRCNYRCTYCMPEQGLPYGPRSDLLTLEEVEAVCRAFAAWGVERVRLTGGEPTLRRGLVDLVARLSTVPTRRGYLEVVMTTNGERLAELAEPLRRAGLAGLTVSLDSLDAGRFARITRRGDLGRVVAGIDAARRAGYPKGLKLNAVAVAGFNDDELAALAKFAWARDAVVRFIELMPMADGELFVPGALMPAATVRGRLEAALEAPLVPDDGDGVRGAGPARYFRVAAGPYEGKRVGTIAAMTENFCADCNRLRISATGQLHGCLARDDTGDLRAALRSAGPDGLQAVVREVLASKRDAHGFELDGRGGPKKAMVSIGG